MNYQLLFGIIVYPSHQMHLILKIIGCNTFYQFFFVSFSMIYGFLGLSAGNYKFDVRMSGKDSTITILNKFNQSFSFR